MTTHTHHTRTASHTQRANTTAPAPQPVQLSSKAPQAQAARSYFNAPIQMQETQRGPEEQRKRKKKHLEGGISEREALNAMGISKADLDDPEHHQEFNDNLRDFTLKNAKDDYSWFDEYMKIDGVYKESL